jgi:hypothetical protein
MARPSAGRIVRQTPPWERVKSLFSIDDNQLWLEEAILSFDWEAFDKTWGTVLAIALNLIFIFARVNSGASASGSDLFVDEPTTSSGFFAWLCSLINYVLLTSSVTNALYATLRTKQYRLFHTDTRQIPSTPSARRVKVDSSPATSSPLRLLSKIIAKKADEHDHSDDPEKDYVWEISVWDPVPISLRLAVLFSPGNVIVTCFLLPTHSSNPGLAVAYVVAICTLLSGQGYILQKYFSQQNKDSTSIYSQVSKEYDTKFVHPNTEKKAVRDVGIQFPPRGHVEGRITPVPEVVSTKSYHSPKGFTVRPNPAYAAHYDRNDFLSTERNSETSQRFVTPQIRQSHYASVAPSSDQEMSSPIRPPQSTRPFPSPEKSKYSHTGTGTGDGGSLGVYSHAASPLRKTASANLLRGQASGVRNREGSPLKRTSTPAGSLFRSGYSSRDE